MSDQLLGFDEAEHDRTGGPPPPFPVEWGQHDETDNEGHYPSYGVPLQEQCEDAEEQSDLLGVALDRAVDVIEALLKDRSERANDVYQAQLDAQDWQNRNNASSKVLKEVRDALPRRYDGLYLESAARALHEDLVAAESRTCDEEQIRELTAQLQTQVAHMTIIFKRNEELTWQNDQLEVKLEEKSKDYRELLAKSQHQVVYQMPDNLLAELHDLRERNARQADRIVRARNAIDGLDDEN